MPFYSLVPQQRRSLRLCPPAWLFLIAVLIFLCPTHTGCTFTEVLSIAKDSRDNAYYVGHHGSNFYIGKHAACGVEWKTIDSPTFGEDDKGGFTERFYDVIVASDGLVYAVGSTGRKFSSSTGKVLNMHAAIVVYHPDTGEALRRMKYDLPANFDSVARAIVEKPSGNVLVAVYGSSPNVQESSTFGPVLDTRLLEINPDTLQVQASFSLEITTTEVLSVTGGPKVLDFVYEDSTNSIIAVGHVLGRGILWRYSLTTGEVVSQAEWGAVFAAFETSGFTADGNGGFFVVGSSSDRVLSNQDPVSRSGSEFHAYVIRYDGLTEESTSPTWVRQLAATQGSQSGKDIVIDPVSKELVVIGSFDSDFEVSDSQTSTSFAVTALSNDGLRDVFLWYLDAEAGDFSNVAVSTLASTMADDGGNAVEVLSTRIVVIGGVINDGADESPVVCDEFITVSPGTSVTPSVTPTLIISVSMWVLPTSEETTDSIEVIHAPPSASNVGLEGVSATPSASLSSLPLGFSTSPSKSSVVVSFSGTPGASPAIAPMPVSANLSTSSVALVLLSATPSAFSADIPAGLTSATPRPLSSATPIFSAMANPSQTPSFSEKSEKSLPPDFTPGIAMSASLTSTFRLVMPFQSLIPSAKQAQSVGRKNDSQGEPGPEGTPQSPGPRYVESSPSWDFQRSFDPSPERGEWGFKPSAGESIAEGGKGTATPYNDISEMPDLFPGDIFSPSFWPSPEASTFPDRHEVESTSSGLEFSAEPSAEDRREGLRPSAEVTSVRGPFVAMSMPPSLQSSPVDSLQEGWESIAFRLSPAPSLEESMDGKLEHTPWPSSEQGGSPDPVAEGSMPPGFEASDDPSSEEGPGERNEKGSSPSTEERSSPGPVLGGSPGHKFAEDRSEDQERELIFSPEVSGLPLPVLGGYPSPTLESPPEASVGGGQDGRGVLTTEPPLDMNTISEASVLSFGEASPEASLEGSQWEREDWTPKPLPILTGAPVPLAEVSPFLAADSSIGPSFENPDGGDSERLPGLSPEESGLLYPIPSQSSWIEFLSSGEPAPGDCQRVPRERTPLASPATRGIAAPIAIGNPSPSSTPTPYTSDQAVQSGVEATLEASPGKTITIGPLPENSPFLLPDFGDVEQTPKPLPEESVPPYLVPSASPWFVFKLFSSSEPSPEGSEAESAEWTPLTPPEKSDFEAPSAHVSPTSNSTLYRDLCDHGGQGANDISPEQSKNGTRTPGPHPEMSPLPTIKSLFQPSAESGTSSEPSLEEGQNGTAVLVPERNNSTISLVELSSSPYMDWLHESTQPSPDEQPAKVAKLPNPTRTPRPSPIRTQKLSPTQTPAPSATRTLRPSPVRISDPNLHSEVSASLAMKPTLDPSADLIRTPDIFPDTSLSPTVEEKAEPSDLLLSPTQTPRPSLKRNSDPDWPPKMSPSTMIEPCWEPPHNHSHDQDPAPSISPSPNQGKAPTLKCEDRANTTAFFEELEQRDNLQRVNMVIQVAGANLTNRCGFTSEIAERFIDLSAANTQSREKLWFVTLIEDGPAVYSIGSGLVSTEEDELDTSTLNVSVPPSPSTLGALVSKELYHGSVIFEVTAYMIPLSVELVEVSYMEYVESQSIVEALKDEGFNSIEWTGMVTAPFILDRRWEAEFEQKSTTIAGMTAVMLGLAVISGIALTFLKHKDLARARRLQHRPFAEIV